MYRIKIRASLDKQLGKLIKRNRKQYELIMKKVGELQSNPHRFKNLRAPLENWKRIRIVKSFVLVYSVDEENKVVRLEKFDHHDKIYKH